MSPTTNVVGGVVNEQMDKPFPFHALTIEECYKYLQVIGNHVIILLIVTMIVRIFKHLPHMNVAY
jgi:hypothetical protein